MLRYFNQHQLNAFLNKVDELFFLATTDAQLIYVNDSFLTTTGQSESAILGKSLYTICSDASEGLLRQMFVNSAASNDKTEPFLVQFKNSDDYYSFWLFPVKGEDGAVSHIAGEARKKELDKQTVKDIEASNLDFHILADNIAQLAWMADANGWIYWYNKRWFDYTGTTLEEMQGWGWKKVHHPDHVDRVVKRIQRSWNTGEPWEDIFPLRSVTGEFRWFLSRALPIRNDKGQVIRWIGTNTDVTEQQQAEQELVDASVRKDEFLAILGHELRNPVATLIAAIDDELQPVSDNDRRQQQVIMRRQVHRLKRLVDDLVDLSRISRGKITLDADLLDLNEVVKQCVENLMPDAGMKNQRIDFSLAQTPLEMKGDLIRLQQAVGNVIHNAIKYSPEESVIKITTGIGEEHIFFKCVDSGIGIPVQKLKLIFEPFTQLDVSSDRNNTGLGIGLSLVSQLVELHGGTIKAESDGIGNGSSFTLYFPVTNEQRTPVISLEKIRLPVNQRRILLAEDNEDLALLLKKQFEKAGHEVVGIIGNGLEVSDAVNLVKPDFVFMDIGLPGKDGWQVATELKDNPLRSSFVLVGMSGYTADEQRINLFNKYLLKPVNVNKLLAILVQD